MVQQGVELNWTRRTSPAPKKLLNYQGFQKLAWEAEIKWMGTSELQYTRDALANKGFQGFTKKY